MKCGFQCVSRTSLSSGSIKYKLEEIVGGEDMRTLMRVLLPEGVQRRQPRAERQDVDANAIGE